MDVIINKESIYNITIRNILKVVTLKSCIIVNVAVIYINIYIRKENVTIMGNINRFLSIVIKNNLIYKSCLCVIKYNDKANIHNVKYNL